MVTVNKRHLCENCFAETETDRCPSCGFDPLRMENDPIALKPGSVLNGRYMTGGVIGKGGFGITYLAYDLKLDSRLAVKEYYPMGMALRAPGSATVSVSNRENEESFKNGAEKFYNEAKMVARFNGNPNIVSVHDFFYENDTVYFTMGYLKGETLKAWLKQSKLTEGQAVRLMQDISNALMAVHSSNILHRDISPDNIMLCDDGSIKLLDFGAARQVMAEQSQSLSVILKQGFAPLEQYQKRGRQGPWTDIYALGATVYTALTGESLDDPMTRFENDSELMGSSHGISEELWMVLKKCIMLKIDDRYQDVFELRKDLNNLSIEAEPIKEGGPDIRSLPEGRTAKAFESLVQETDPNATELLSYDDRLTKAENETVLLSRESDNGAPAEVSYQEPVRIVPQSEYTDDRSTGDIGQPETQKPVKPPKSKLPLIIIAAAVLIAAVFFIVRNAGSSRTAVDEDVINALEIQSYEPDTEEQSSEETSEEAEEETEEAGSEAQTESTADTVDDGETPFAYDEENTGDPLDTEDADNEEAEAYNDNAEFGLDGTECDSYGELTESKVYRRYISDIDRFSFAYPTILYSSVTKEDGTVNGREFERVNFKRSDGSRLYYSATRYSDSVSVEEETDYVYSGLDKYVDEVAVISPVKIEDGEGFFIVTGREIENPDNLVYIMVRVSRDYVFRMEVTFPDFENDDDRDYKSYYTECLYRLCGFTNSSNRVRSFVDYKLAQQ